MLYQNLENAYGQQYSLPIGSREEITMPNWQGHSVCQSTFTIDIFKHNLNLIY